MASLIYVWDRISDPLWASTFFSVKLDSFHNVQEIKLGFPNFQATWDFQQLKVALYAFSWSIFSERTDRSLLKHTNPKFVRWSRCWPSWANMLWGWLPQPSMHQKLLGREGIRTRIRIHVKFKLNSSWLSKNGRCSNQDLEDSWTWSSFFSVRSFVDKGVSMSFLQPHRHCACCACCACDGGCGPPRFSVLEVLFHPSLHRWSTNELFNSLHEKRYFLKRCSSELVQEKFT